MRLDDRPWFTDECRSLYKTHKTSLFRFNREKTYEARIKLCTDKENYKKVEHMFKRQYKRQEGNMLDFLRKYNRKSLRKIARIVLVP